MYSFISMTVFPSERFLFNFEQITKFVVEMEGIVFWVDGNYKSNTLTEV